MYPGVGTFVLIRPTQTFYERINHVRDTMRPPSRRLRVAKPIPGSSAACRREKAPVPGARLPPWTAPQTQAHHPPEAIQCACRAASPDSYEPIRNATGTSGGGEPAFLPRPHPPYRVAQSNPGALMLTRRRPPVYHRAIAEPNTIVEERP